ncbi:putative multiple sugar ABC transporter permease [Actinacidiphila reveromycinica]|uniref:Putative multiple sugar ABC transporter permease n=1 Tax=Actinacidiphila reveromycinica TaxID=659352 RepID=A0A7U3VMU3_9ACTN|nr:carbohydrate ABC transporter permease [Streptomyces sp. SN-593]BBA96904.1 putative multiple sugar ABC transporter permease [Streptomyces sp. SN-593]
MTLAGNAASAAASAPERHTAVRTTPTSGFGHKVGSLLRNGIVQAVLVAVGLVWLTPTVGLLVSSLRPGTEEDSSGWWTAFIHPSTLTFSNYSHLLDNGDITQAFWNTVLISVPATAAVVVIAALAGYAFAWLRFPGRDAVFLVVVGMLVVPVQIGLLPVAKLFGAVGIFGSIYGVILFHVAYGLPFAIFLLRNYFAEIPKEMLEAARMDGGTEWTIFTRLILPVGKPALASLTIFQFLWVWNDMLVSLIFADSQSQPLTVALQSQMRQFGANIDVLAPGAFLSLIVPLLVFFAFQRHFVEGVMAGSVK